MSVDPSTSYLGLPLKNPLGVTACPTLAGDLDMLQAGRCRRRRGLPAVIVGGTNEGSMSRGNCPDPSALERANYMQTLTNDTMQHPAPPGS